MLVYLQQELVETPAHLHPIMIRPTQPAPTVVTVSPNQELVSMEDPAATVDLRPAPVRLEQLEVSPEELIGLRTALPAALADQQEVLDPQDLLGPKDRQVQMDLLGQMVLQDQPDPLARKVLVGRQEQQDPKVQRAHQDLRVVQDMLFLEMHI